MILVFLYLLPVAISSLFASSANQDNQLVAIRRDDNTPSPPPLSLLPPSPSPPQPPSPPPPSPKMEPSASPSQEKVNLPDVLGNIFAVNLDQSTEPLVHFSAQLNYQASLNEPYKSAKILPFDDHGWLYYPDELKAEASIVANAGGKVFVELGSWMGKSTRLIASVIPDDAKLYAVDTWKGSLDEEAHMNDPRLPLLYEIFLSNMIQSGHAHRVEPMRMTTTEGVKVFDKKIDFLFVDASHEYDDVWNDIMSWYPLLTDDGVICGDDWEWDSVRSAVIDAAAKLNLEVSIKADNFWKMERSSKN